MNTHPPKASTFCLGHRLGRWSERDEQQQQQQRGEEKRGGERDEQQRGEKRRGEGERGEEAAENGIIKKKAAETIFAQRQTETNDGLTYQTPSLHYSDSLCTKYFVRSLSVHAIIDVLGRK